MAIDTGFFYLRAGDEWPTFVLHGLEIASDGALVLSIANPSMRSSALARTKRNPRKRTGIGCRHLPTPSRQARTCSCSR